MTDVEPTTKETYAQLSGYSQSTIFSTKKFNWIIWNIDEDKDKLIIISDDIDDTESFYFWGAQGYNNGVGILHAIGATCYSNSTIGAIGRSVSIEDINIHATKKFESYRTVTCNDTEYPLVHSMEEYSNVNGELLLPGSQYAPGNTVWSNSEQKEFISTKTIGDLEPGMATSNKGVSSLGYDFGSNRLFYCLYRP